ncbi:palmitoyltransferase Akr1p [Trichomonascus vanleenenianus]|uniref:ankyrin repeat domain-containing DHHC palmitoyltransferase family protein n=1 Tax=Trichomonascus vanleenenianus TaxID=2268995 RepID=UPI003ECAE870
MEEGVSSESEVSTPGIPPQSVGGVSKPADPQVSATSVSTESFSAPPKQPEPSELIKAGQAGDLTKMKQLFEDGDATAQTVEPDGTTALHWAAINNHLSVCKYLIECGAVIDAKGGELEATPLHWACRNGLVYIAHLLIQHGADPLRTDAQGFNALHLGVYSSNVLVVIYLLHQGLPVDTVDPAGRTALHWAAYQGDALTVDCLLNWGASAKLTDSLGFTPLHWSIVRGNRVCMRRLIEEGSDVFAKNNDGKSPRVMAEEMKTTASWQAALVEAGRLPNGSPRPQRLSKKQVDIVAFLLPFATLGLVMATLAALPVYLGIPAALAEIWVSISSLKRLILPNAYRGHGVLTQSPILSGIFAGSCFWVLVCYVLEVLPATFGRAPLVNALFAVTFGTVLYTFFRAMLMDPGYVPKLSGVTEQREVIEELIDLGEYDTRHFCIMTLTRKPLRSKYDRSSKKVVAKFDHYCPWVNNVIGARNHRIFLIYVVALMCGIPMILWLYFGVFVDTIPQADEGDCAFAPLVLCTPLKYSSFMTQAIVWAGLQLSWVVVLVFVQLVQVSKGMTTSEAANLHRFGFMGADDFSSLPMDHKSVAAAGPGAVEAFKHARQKRWYSSISKVLGIDQFLSTAQDTFGRGTSHNRSSNPVDYGVVRNCLDFWVPTGGGCNVFKVGESGEARLNGQAIDYYTLWEFPSKTRRQRSPANAADHEYEMVNQV